MSRRFGEKLREGLESARERLVIAWASDADTNRVRRRTAADREGFSRHHGDAATPRLGDERIRTPRLRQVDPEL